MGKEINEILDKLQDSWEHNKSNTADFIDSETAVNQLLENKNKNGELCQPTLFEDLDKNFNGGLVPGLYIMGALPSLGKTTFALQVGSNLCKGGSDILFCNLEMSAEELTAKRISRFTYEFCEEERYAKTESAVTRGEFFNIEDDKFRKTEEDVLNKAIEHVKKESGFYIAWQEPPISAVTIEEIEGIVETFIAEHNKPILIVDYLQIIKPKDDYKSDKSNVDTIVSTLKRISGKYKIPVIAISSLNRQNYKVEVNLASFKESGSIEFGTDVLLGMQLKNQGEKSFKLGEAMSSSPRQIIIKILKNRKGGGVYKDILYDYYPKFNYFKERYELNNNE